MGGLVNEIKVKQESISLHCDSQSAKCLMKNQVYHAGTKHIVVMYHWIRDWVSTCEISVEKIHKDDNTADMLTKPIASEKFRHCFEIEGASHLQ